MAFIEQAEETIDGIHNLTALMKRYRDILFKKNTPSNVILLMEHLFANPYIMIPSAVRFLGTTYPSAKNAIMTLVDAGILKQANIRHRSKVFVAEEIEKIIQCLSDFPPSMGTLSSEP